LLQALYNNAIWIDIANGTTGAVPGVNGTPANPVNNLANAVTLAAAIGVRAYFVRGNLTLVSAHDNWTFRGLGTEPVIALNGQDVQDSFFESVELSGDAANSHIHTHDCTLDGVTNFSGVINASRLRNSMSLAANGTMFSHCVSFVPGAAATPILDVQGAGRTFQFRAYSGGLELRNMSDAGNIASVELVAGQVILAATCTGGQIALRGVGNLTDNSAGTTVKSTALLSNPEIAEAVHARERYTKRDQIVYTDGFMTSARERWFPTRADAIAETNVTDTFTVTATPDGVETKSPATLDKIRDVECPRQCSQRAGSVQVGEG
jgi:hypothetical protein